jgi:hypothetical protein
MRKMVLVVSFSRYDPLVWTLKILLKYIFASSYANLFHLDELQKYICVCDYFSFP